MKPTLVILAAGVGSRYGGQKQIASVGPNQEILLDYAVFDAIRAGYGKVIFVISQKMENFFNTTIRPRYKNKIVIEYAFQELNMLPQGYYVPKDRIKPWGTGHAILITKPLISEPFAVINADDFYGTTSFEILADHLYRMKNDSKEFFMVGFQIKNTLSEHGKVSRGICTSDGDTLVSIIEREKIEKQNGKICCEDDNGVQIGIDQDSLASMNMWGFSPDILFPFLESEFRKFLDDSTNYQSEFYIPTVVDSAIKQKKASVTILQSKEKWFGLTYPEDKIKVQQQIQKNIETGIYPVPLFS